MNKIAILLAALAVGSPGFAVSAEGHAEKSLKVLMIGNSFSICNLKQMPHVAKSMGLKLDIASLYIGGCSLERHWNNVVASTNAAFKPYRFDRATDGVKVAVKGTANIPGALVLEKWDVVTIQQASHFSWRPETYHPFGDRLIAKIRELAPQAKILVQETWSYPPWDRRLKKFGFDQAEMYERLHRAYAAFAARHGLDVIPVGTAAERVPNRNALFTKPDFHFNREGEYLQGLAFTAKLFGVDVRRCPYRPLWMKAARADEIKVVVMDAVAPSHQGALSCAAGDADWISAELAKPVLGADAGRSSWRAVLAEVERADAACDAAWRRMKTREELQQYGKDLRSRMIHAMGGFPSERCPLNARTVAVRKRDGYTVENVLFESWPGVHVSANLYLPDATRFPPPHPCVLISCGHSGDGKSAPNYGRGGVMSARAGIAALVVDPFAQGERVQERGRNPALNWDEHNRIGSLAVLLGGGFPRFRVWDAMRALDYLETRPDIDAKALGCMGNSGGGNVTAFLQAVDPRLAATVPAGYICSFARAAEKASIGPGDACQNIFGQLSFGLNHASFCLMSAPLPVRVQAYRGDIVFPFDGTRHTVELAEDVMKRLGWEDRFGMTDMEGGHLWYEGSRASSIDWMKRWLRGDAAALARTTEEYRALNKGFDKKTSDCGPGKSDGSSCGGGGVLSLPGERTVYDVMRDDLKAAIRARKGKITSADVRRIAGIAEPSAVPLSRIEISEETRGSVRIVREAYVRPDGLKLPAVVFIPTKISGAPVIALNAASRKNSAEAVAKYVASGRPVMSIDLTGTGEIGQYGRKKGGSYYSRKGRDEELSVLLYALGQSLVGRQAAELQEVALDLKLRFGASPDIFTRGRMAVAAAHAFAVNKGLFGTVECVNPPPSWSESVRKALDTPMAICVNGALLSYDWTELASGNLPD